VRFFQSGSSGQILALHVWNFGQSYITASPFRRYGPFEYPAMVYSTLPFTPCSTCSRFRGIHGNGQHWMPEATRAARYLPAFGKVAQVVPVTRTTMAAGNYRQADFWR